jgi:hypothetical protein
MSRPTCQSWLAVATIGATLLGGCSYVPTTRLDYTPIQTGAAPPVKHTLVVVPLSEDRPPRTYPSELNHMFLAYVPLLPYFSIPYERLDDSLNIATQERGAGPLPRDELFPTKMAKRIADDLRQSNLFSDVQFVPEGAGSADYVLGGLLRSTEFDVNVTSYMLGPAGVLLWLLPIPVGSDTADVVIDLMLRDAQGNLVWQFPLNGNGRRIYTAYGIGAPVSNVISLEIAHYGSNDKGIDGDSLWAYHADALRSGMGEAKASLAAFLASSSGASQSAH